MRLYCLRRTPTASDVGSPEWVRRWSVIEEVIAPGAGECVARVSALNPLADPAPSERAASPVVLRSGLAAMDAPEGPVLPWMPRSRSRFEEFCRTLAALGGSYWLWPGTQGVLSDVPSTQSFLRGHAGGKFHLFLDAASLLTREMLPKADDHLERIFAALGSHEALAGVLLANIEAGGDLEGVRLSPLSRGVLRPRLLVELWRAHCPRDTPLVLLEERFEEQAALVGA